MAQRNPVVAALLSATVLPGMGQLYLGRRRLGVALIVATTVALIITAVAAAIAVSHLSLTPPFTPDELRAAGRQLAEEAGAPLRCGTLLLVGAWVVGVVDALWPRRKSGDRE